jgi:hypothetical protein
VPSFVPMCMLDLMDDQRALALLPSNLPMTPEMLFSNSTATTGRAVRSKSVRIDLPALGLALEAAVDLVPVADLAAVSVAVVEALEAVEAFKEASEAVVVAALVAADTKGVVVTRVELELLLRFPIHSPITLLLAPIEVRRFTFVM